MKKIKSLLKGSPIAMVVVGLLIAGVASAALLTLYVTMTGTADVQQSVVFGNGEVEKTYTIGDSPAIAGNTYTDGYNLMNRSETTAPIKFVTTYSYGGNSWWNSEEGIDTSYWSTLRLENKGPAWEILGDNIYADLTYNLVANNFEYELEATGLEVGEFYSLIYYADKQDRFDDYGGNNPGALIAKIKADSSGNISTEGKINLRMNLPALEDWNGSPEANYCTEASDNYNLCRGAKIWLVPSSDYNETSKKIRDASWANMANFLFETDLITYNDLNNKGEVLYLGEGKLNFFVKNVLDIALTPQQYMVKTEIMPAP